MRLNALYKIVFKTLVFGCLLLLNVMASTAQIPGLYSVKNGKMYIQIGKGLRESAVDSFITRYDLSDLPLKQFLKNGKSDSLKKLGWSVESNTSKYFIISKSLTAANNMANPAEKIILAGKKQLLADILPVNYKPVQFGFNSFRARPFAVSGNVVTFILRYRKDAYRVFLAGSFNNWSPTALQMIKTDSGWIAKVKLDPGKYWYKFIIDGGWYTDDDNRLVEGDGRGNENSVYYKTNMKFRLNSTNYKKVFVAGSFNNWKPNQIALVKTATGFELESYLAEGTHRYKFIADGQWMADPGNKNRFPDGIGAYNSVISIGKPQIFSLSGFDNAKEVQVYGSFNGWRANELYLRKTASGWEMPYVLSSGNYEYKFIVDGKAITDPANPLVANAGKNSNSLFVIDPNYTFRLRGRMNASTVIVSGDFTGWSETKYYMRRNGNEWILPLNLSVGKHLYKFIVDGEWILDPGNKLWEQNEFGTGNSIVWVEEPGP